MLPAMAVKPRIAIVGPGRLGRALTLKLQRAGYVISEIVSRDRVGSRQTARQLARKVGAHASTGESAHLDADVVWFCVPDREIAPVASQLASVVDWKRKTAFHSSGALASDELDLLRRRGAAVASVHPLMTFVSGSIPPLKGVPFAVEGDAIANRVARRIVRDLGGEAFTIRKQHKAAYHAWGAFLSPLLLATLATAEQVARAAGLSAVQARKKMLPIIRQTIANYEALGPARAFSGPIVRGDAEIVRKHVQALRKIPEARDVYLALARAALRHLPTRNRKELEKEIEQGLRRALGAVEIGDRVRLTGIPPAVAGGKPETKALFKRCVGKVFPVAGFEKGLIELEVGSVVGDFPAAHSIWIEPEFLERVEKPK
jgi:predicted short-subunit dehydrogenase-like oxidoreductase (DUF2520 family)